MVNSYPYFISPTDEEWIAADVTGVEPNTVLIFDISPTTPDVIVITELKQELIEGDQVNTLIGNVNIPATRINEVIDTLMNASQRSTYVKDLTTQTGV